MQFNIEGDQRRYYKSLTLLILFCVSGQAQTKECSDIIDLFGDIVFLLHSCLWNGELR